MHREPPAFYFSKEYIETKSPSRLDGIPLKKEASIRRLCHAFILDIGKILRLQQATTFSAIVYWQRFFLHQSLCKNDPYIIATAAVLLSGKVEEDFRSLRTITETAYFVQSKNDSTSLERLKSDPKLLASEMEKVTKAEEVLLVTLDFDLVVLLPHRHLLPIAKHLRGKYSLPNDFFQVAANFLNDSFRTTLCVQPVPPVDVVVACVELAATNCKVQLRRPTEEVPWWQAFDAKSEALPDVQKQIMSLYRKVDVSGSASTRSAAAASARKVARPQAQRSSSSRSMSNSLLNRGSHVKNTNGSPDAVEEGEVVETATKCIEAKQSLAAKQVAAMSKAPGAVADNPDCSSVITDELASSEMKASNDGVFSPGTTAKRQAEDATNERSVKARHVEVN